MGTGIVPGILKRHRHGRTETTKDWDGVRIAAVRSIPIPEIPPDKVLRYHDTPGYFSPPFKIKYIHETCESINDLHEIRVTDNGPTQATAKITTKHQTL